MVIIKSTTVHKLGLYLTQNRSNHSGSVEGGNSSGRMSLIFSRVSVNFKEIRLDLAGFYHISTRSWRDQAESQRNQAEFRRDLASSQQIGQNQTSQPLQSTENSKFSVCRRSGWLEIGFPRSNPSTDPPVSSFGVEPTIDRHCHQVSRFLSRIGRVR